MSIKTISLSLVYANGGSVIDYSNLQFAFFAQPLPFNFGAPEVTGNGVNITGGLFEITLHTALNVGDTGFLILTNTNGSSAQSPSAIVFAGPVLINNGDRMSTLARNAYSFDSVAEFNSFGGAVVYGEGPLWIAGQQYWSNGSTYTLSSGGGAATVISGVLYLGTSISSFLTISTPSENKINNLSNSYAYWAAVALDQPFENYINKGVGGDTTRGMLARYAADVAANLSNFDLLVLEMGPNDYSTPGILYAEIVANVETMVSNAMSAGKLVLLIAPSPSESPNSITNPSDAGVLKRQKVMAWLATYVPTVPGLLYYDPSETLSDPATGAPLPSAYLPTTIEGTRVHPGIVGAQTYGKGVANVIKPFVGKSSLSASKLNPSQYMPNPRLSGNNASGSNKFFAGAGITVTGGPDACAIALTRGTWVGGTNTCTIEPYANTGIEDKPAGGTLITVVNAPSDQAEITIVFGGNYNTVAGTQFGYWSAAANWAATTPFTVGNNVLNGAFPSGIWVCIRPGTSGATIPAPSSDTNFGELKTDGTVLWMWKKIPAAGDIFQAEIPYEIKSLAGNMTLSASALVINSNTLAASSWGQANFPYYDNTNGSPGAGLPGNTIPRAGKLKSEKITLVNPGSAVRYVQLQMTFVFTAGSGCSIYIPEVNFRKLN